MCRIGPGGHGKQGKGISSESWVTHALCLLLSFVKIRDYLQSVVFQVSLNMLRTQTIKLGPASLDSFMLCCGVKSLITMFASLVSLLFSPNWKVLLSPLHEIICRLK